MTTLLRPIFLILGITLLAGRTPPPHAAPFPDNPHDVNRDGVVSPLDALEVIRYLNAGSGSQPGNRYEPLDWHSTLPLPPHKPQC